MYWVYEDRTWRGFFPPASEVEVKAGLRTGDSKRPAVRWRSVQDFVSLCEGGRRELRMLPSAPHAPVHQPNLPSVHAMYMHYNNGRGCLVPCCTLGQQANHTSMEVGHHVEGNEATHTFTRRMHTARHTWLMQKYIRTCNTACHLACIPATWARRGRTTTRARRL